MGHKNKKGETGEEIKLFYLPAKIEDKDDITSKFTFMIAPDGSNKNITVTIQYKDDTSSEAMWTSPYEKGSPPTHYTLSFDNKGVCSIDGFQTEDYNLFGSIKVVTFNSPIGQFALNRKNFEFDIYFKRYNDSRHHVTGMFELADPE